MSLDSVIETLVRAGKIQPPRLPELGKIKIGGLGDERTAQTGKNYRMPVKHDYFTVTTCQRGPDGRLIEDTELMDHLKGKYADGDGQLRQIPVRLLSNEIDDALQSAFVYYRGKQVAARSDGKTLVAYVGSDGKRLATPVEKPWEDSLLEKGFKVHTTLSCIIASEQSKFGGLYRFRTTGIISLGNLKSSLTYIAACTNGVLVGMPLFLVVRPYQVSPEGKTTTVPAVHIEMRGPDLLQIQNQAREQARFMLEYSVETRKLQQQYKQLLLPPGTETGKEAEEVAEEFAPETLDVTVESAPTNYRLLDEGDADGTGAAPAEEKAPAPTTEASPAQAPVPESQEEAANRPGSKGKRAACESDRGDDGHGPSDTRDDQAAQPGVAKASWVVAFEAQIAAATKYSLLSDLFDNLVKAKRSADFGTEDDYGALFDQWIKRILPTCSKSTIPVLIAKIRKTSGLPDDWVVDMLDRAEARQNELRGEA